MPEIVSDLPRLLRALLGAPGHGIGVGLLVSGLHRPNRVSMPTYRVIRARKTVEDSLVLLFQHGKDREIDLAFRPFICPSRHVILHGMTAPSPFHVWAGEASTLRPSPDFALLLREFGKAF